MCYNFVGGKGKKEEAKTELATKMTGTCELLAPKKQHDIPVLVACDSIMNNKNLYGVQMAAGSRLPRSNFFFYFSSICSNQVHVLASC